MEENKTKGEKVLTLPLSDEFNGVLNYIKSNLSKELPTLTISLDYFLLGVLSEKKSNLYKRLYGCLTSNAMLALNEALYQLVSSKALTAVKTGREIKINSDLQNMILNAEKEAKLMDSPEITTEHVFLAILGDTDSSNKIRKVFVKAGLTYGIVKNKMKNDSNFEDMDKNNPFGNGIKVMRFDNLKDAEKFFKKIEDGNMDDMMNMFGGNAQKKKTGKNPNIKAYCTDLNELAEQGKADFLIGRDREVNEIIRILGRKKKNNAILVGGEGVGKTAIGESLALKITLGDVPEFLVGKRLVSLDMTALMAGTTLRGMFEERVKGILDEIKADPSFILFMDNIGAILADNGKNDYDIASMLSRALDNGEIQVIGTSDFTSYRKTFDKDPSLARRFQRIVVEAPDADESIKILNGLKSSYENFHKVKYTDDAINACVLLANRYISERNLPDSAIDVMDEAGALMGTITENPKIKTLRVLIKMQEADVNVENKNKNYEAADKSKNELIKMKKEYNDLIDKEKENRKNNPIIVDKNVILDIISNKTNIPVNNLTSDDKQKLAHMNDRIKEHVIGQDEAVDTICKALKRNRIGLKKNGCMYSAFIIGKTGCGKTLIAKQLAKELFGDEKALVRFDMSEFSDKVAVNKLIGSNPGYVGYEEGGQLTEKIKNKKHCVLLLDEIEKADPEIYNIFLQVLDEGFLTDNSGMKVDFKNVIVIFTSNVGAKAASDFGKGIGFNEDSGENSRKILLKQLKNKFPPEFLNRLDDVIYFNKLTDDNYKSIIKLEINKLENKLSEIGYSIEYGDDIVNHILDIVKNEKDYGARPIVRAIQDVIENKITDALLEKDYDNGYKFKISCSPSGDVTVA